MKIRRHRPAARSSSAFTLLEILVSTAVLAILMLVCLSALDQTQKTWKFSQGKVEQFREARLAFETITRHLSQATLNTYWDYYYADTGSNEPPEDATVQPSAYVRQSELQFRVAAAPDLLGAGYTPAVYPGHAVFFQAPLGLSENQRELGSLLNARGFFIQFGGDSGDRPGFLTERGIREKFRYRLMEYRPPAERAATSLGNTVYVRPLDWFQQNLATSTQPVADNIILLLISPRVTESAATAANRNATWIAPGYRYHSLDRDNSTGNLEPVQIRQDGTADQGTQHLLPPVLQITMVAVDEPSAEKLAQRYNNAAVDILRNSGAVFTEVLRYDQDLALLKDYLKNEQLNYRVFTSKVAMRNARWDGRN